MPATKSPPDSVNGPWKPLGEPAFLALWSASLLSNLGTWMNNVAAAWLMEKLTHSPLWVALVPAAAGLPVFFFGLLAGALADRLDRRRSARAGNGTVDDVRCRCPRACGEVADVNLDRCRRPPTGGVELRDPIGLDRVLLQHRPRDVSSLAQGAEEAVVDVKNAQRGPTKGNARGLVVRLLEENFLLNEWRYRG